VVDADEPVIVMQPDIAAMREYKSLRDLAPDSATVQLLTDTIVLAIDLFKLSMASLLAIFVPQLCPGSSVVRAFTFNASATVPTQVSTAIAQFSTSFDGCTSNPVSHECTFEENFACLSRLNLFVIIWNFLCLGGE
jgi:hypothetical protein